MTDYQCQPCQQSFKTKAAYSKHISSQKHQKNISSPPPQQPERILPKPSEEQEQQQHPFVSCVLDETAHIRYFFHISDIHIPCDKRHDEYRQIFRVFLSHVDSHPHRNDAAIVITGDLLDHKNRITPEEVVLAREFILDLAHRCPVFIIAGNHDKNLSFPLKEDNISAIVSNGRFPHKRVHYLKKSGWYRFGNVTFGVSSVLDGRMVKIGDVPENEYRVALHHGGVGKYTLYNNGTSKESSIPLSTFDGFDVVLLGDIHKWQFLDAENRIAYAGSMLQKNHGETWSDHGYLFWELEKKTATHHPLENEYRFVTLTITDGVLMTPLDGLPRHLYVRWELKETGTQLRSPVGVQEEIRKKFVVEEETYQHSTFFVEKPYAEGPRTIFDLGVGKQFEYMLSWIEHEKKREFVGDDLYMLEAMNIHYNEQIQEFMIPAVHWKLLDLQFENIFCYQEKQTISFSHMKGVNGIVAPNHAGKSAIFDILLFTLFGRCTRSDMFSYMDLVHVPTNKEAGNDRLNCFLRFQTIEKNDIYQIERSCSKEKSTMTVKITKNDSVIYEGSARDANATIIKLVGTYDDFLTTTVLAQQSEHNFLALHGKIQKEFTSRMFCLDLYEKLHKQVKKEIKMAETDVAVLEQSYQTYLQDNPADKHSKCIDEQSDLFLQESKIEEEIKEKEVERERLWSTFRPLLPNQPTESLDELNKKKTMLCGEKIKIRKEGYENEEQAKAEKVEIERSLHQIQEILIQPFAKQLESLWVQIQKARNLLRTTRGEKPMLIKTDSLALKLEKHRERYERMLEDQKATQLWLENTVVPTRSVSDESIVALKEKREQLLKTLPQVVHDPSFSLEKERDKKEKKRVYLEELKEVLTLPETTWIEKYQKEVKKLRDERKEYSDRDELQPLNVRKEMEKKQDERKVKLIYLRKEEKKIVEIEEKLKQHRYNPECTFCCENPFVITARKTLVTLPETRQQISSLEVEVEEAEKALDVQKYLLRLDNFRDVVRREIHEVEQEVMFLEQSIQKYLDNEKKLLERQEKESQINVWKEEIEKIERQKEEEDKCKKQHETMTQLKEEWVFFSTEMLALIQQWQEADDKNQTQSDRRIRLYNKLQVCNNYLSLCTLERDLEKKLNEVEEQIKSKSFNEEAGKYNTRIQEQVQTLYSEVQKRQKEHTILVRKIAELDVLLKTSSEKIEAMEETNKKYTRRKRELDLLQLYALMTHHNGIPAFLLRKISHLLEETTNQILSQYSEMRVKIYDESKETVVRVKSPKKSTYLNAKLLCGSESFLIELAFRVAFQLLSNVSKPNFMICDEGWACLDETARSKLRDVLGALLEHNEYILTVSHIQDVKAWMTQAISIEIDEQGKHWIRQS